MKNFDSYLHDTEMLLNIYRPCVWTLAESAEDIHAKLVDSCTHTLIESPAKKTISELFCAIRDYDVDISGNAIESRMKSFSKTYKLIQITDSSLLKLKSFPVYGQLYFNLLYELFFNTNLPIKPNTSMIMDRLDYYDTKTYYAHRKKAIRLFNAIIWDSYPSDLLELLPVIAEKTQSFGWISQAAMEYNQSKK